MNPLLKLMLQPTIYIWENFNDQVFWLIFFISFKYYFIRLLIRTRHHFTRRYSIVQNFRDFLHAILLFLLNIIKIVNIFSCQKKEATEVVQWGRPEDSNWREGSCWVLRRLGCAGGVGRDDRTSTGESTDHSIQWLTFIVKSTIK